ncbi:MAG: phosphoenolpyruvate--protein phosphotransferase [Spirochaetota bacterium]
MSSAPQPLELPAPSGAALRKQDDLYAYLASVAAALAERFGGWLVGVYLVDRATARLKLCAWADASESHVWGSERTPGDLGRRGIDGDDLSVATLRDFMHAGPRHERIATPLHDGADWIGAIVGLSDRPHPDDAPTVFHDAAAQLTAVLTQAEVPIGTRRVEETEESLELPSDAIFGHNAGEGVAVGPAVRFRTSFDRNLPARKIEEDRDQALARFDEALEKTRLDIEQLLADASNEFYDVVSLIFSTHLMMLTDEAFSGAIRSLVEAGQTPEDAVQSVVASYVRTFRDLREARLAEKAQDVRDIGHRLLANLAEDATVQDDVAGHIAVVQDALPSDLIRLALDHASGVVMLGATITAHIAILAQSLGLPVLMTEDRRALEISSRTPLLLDADNGKLLISPSAEQLLDHGIGAAPASAAERAFAGEPAGGPPNEARPDLAAVAATPHATPALAVHLYANVNLLSDARRGAAAGAEGIGLYRSEFPFIVRNDYITEEEQFRVYRTIVRSMSGKPVVLRTADIGGDKLLAGREEERNPFLGVRGIRFSLASRPLFREQLRAMLRAGHDADLRIMFPMVSSAEELRDAREEVERCIAELAEQGVPHHPRPRIGAMVELPSAVVSIEDLAAETDFLSIGTNDLIMYLLAVDRTNERLSRLYRSHHPVVLKTIADVAKRVGDRIGDLSVCGESASDPSMIPFFVGIGITSLSVSPRNLQSVRDTLARYTQETAREFAERILAIRTLGEMDRFLTEYHAPDPLVV